MLGSDVAGGTVLAMVLIPAAMAYAHVAGLPVQIGLYAAVVPVFLYGLLGRIAAMSVGPIASVSLLTGVAVSRSGLTGSDAVALAGTMALLCGVTLAVLSFVGADRLADGVSRPALTGFLAGVGLLIIFSQLDSMLGLPSDHPNNLWADFTEVVADAGSIQPWSLALSAVALLFLVYGPRFASKVPAPLVVVVAGILLAVTLGLEQLGVDMVGDLPQGLPPWGFDFVRLSPTTVLVVVAAVLMAGIQVVAVRSRFQEPDHPAETRQELFALGVASLGAGASSGMPLAASPNRSALAHEAGARTPLTSIVCSFVVAVLLLVGTTWLENLPVPVIAAIVVFAASKLIHPGEILSLWTTDRRSANVALTALIATAINIEAGVVSILALSVLESRRRQRRPDA